MIPCVLKRMYEGTDGDVYECAICHRRITMPRSVPPPRRECDPRQCTPCQCLGAGFCQRHKMGKTEFTYSICKNDCHQRATWDYVTITGQSPHGERPSAARRVLNFSVAAVRHMFSGQGTRTDSEIESILSICHTCPSGRFNGKYCEDLKCGCFLSTKKYFSKVAWADQHCPRGHW